MAKKIYIVSLFHSGSTLLNLLLGCHSKAVALGEIHSVYRKIKDKQRVCTCGEEIDQCRVWSHLFQQYRNNRETFISFYNDLIKNVEGQYSNEHLIIDSSKRLGTLKYLIENGIKDISVLFLIKDVRSFTQSINSLKHSKGKRKKDGWRRIYKYFVPYNIRRWHRENKEIKEYLTTHNVSHFQIGYEELCFFPEEMLRQISKFLEIDFERNMLIPQKSHSHIIRGNRMRFDSNKLSGIKYDARWKNNRMISFLCPLFSSVMNWNDKNVYSNVGLPPLNRS